MLAPDSRAVLLEHLRPPLGSQLDYALATTYTLDLTAALVPPLAFARFRASDDSDPIAVMEAIHASADRLDIFCQAGKVTAPRGASELVTFLEPVVHQVRGPAPGRLFHPKLWLLRYLSEDGEHTYRLLCTSRNLTGDQSWDVVLRLDGAPTGRPSATNRPLAALVRALPGLAVRPLPADRRVRIEEFTEQVRRIEWEHPEDVNEIAFHVLGLPGERSRPDFSGYRHLVVSPFCTDGGLEHVAGDWADVTVVSRPDELDRLSPETLEWADTYAFTPLSALPPPEADPEATPADPPLTGLHAKLYVVERARRAHVFIGSANATDAGFGGNIELLVELVGGASRLGVDTFLPPEPFGNLLEPYQTRGGAEPDPDDEPRQRLDELLRAAAEIRYVAMVAGEAAADRYTVMVATEQPVQIPDGYELRLGLLTHPGLASDLASGVPVKTSFTGLPLIQITPFLVVTATGPGGRTARAVLRADLVGDDPDQRRNAVVASQLDTPEKFLRFLWLVLGIRHPAPVTGDATGRSGLPAGGSGVGPGLFELLVRAVADQPDRLIELDRTIARLRARDHGRQVLPDGLDQIWPVFLAACESEKPHA